MLMGTRLTDLSTENSSGCLQMDEENMSGPSKAMQFYVIAKCFFSVTARAKFTLQTSADRCAVQTT